MKTYEKVYLLLEQAQDYISGESLAQSLNISRTAVWKAIKTLEQKGLTISSQKNRGYFLSQGDLLIPEVIAQETGLPTYLNDSSASTQEDAMAGAAKQDPAPALYLAPSQTAAKGRFGRAFFAPKTGGIYMTLHLTPNLTPDQLPNYTMMMAASITKAIQRLTGIETAIKWVNDIYLGHKKLAGILTQAQSSVETGLVTDIYIGVGLNFCVSHFPEELSHKATSLFSEQAPISRNQLISEIWRLFLSTPERDLIKVYKENSLVLDKRVSFRQNQINYSGTAVALSDEGHLSVRLDDGQVLELQSGEISLTSWEA